MQNGDISNGISPRLVFVFEGLVGQEPRGAERVKSVVAAKARRWEMVAGLWRVEPTMSKQLWDIVWRHGFRFDLVTYLHRPEFAVALYEKLERIVPISNVLWFDSPYTLARNLAVMPDIATVFDGDLGRSLAYGSKGKNITNPAAALL